MVDIMTTQTKYVSKQFIRVFPLITFVSLPITSLTFMRSQGLLGKHKSEYAKLLIPTIIIHPLVSPECVIPQYD